VPVEAVQAYVALVRPDTDIVTVMAPEPPAHRVCVSGESVGRVLGAMATVAVVGLPGQDIAPL